MEGRWKVDTQWATIILVGITLDVRLTTDSKSATKRKVRSRAGSIIYAAEKQTSRPQVITWNALTFQHLQFGLPRGESHLCTSWYALLVVYRMTGELSYEWPSTCLQFEIPGFQENNVHNYQWTCYWTLWNFSWMYNITLSNITLYLNVQVCCW